MAERQRGDMRTSGDGRPPVDARQSGDGRPRGDMRRRMNPALAAVPESGIRRFAALAAAREGCISLTLGEPDFATPEPVKAAAAQALDRNLTHYPPNAGYPELRQAIADFSRRRWGYDYSAQEVIVTAGATEALYTALFSILEPGDQVVVPVPAFGLYGSIIAMLRGETVKVDTSDTGFQLRPGDLERALTPRTKAVILNSPGNPSGRIYSRETLEELHRVLRDRDIFIICDDVYGQLAFDPSYRSFAAFGDMRDRVIVVDSFSKPYAMTGWRMGWLMGDLPLIRAMEPVHQFNVVSVPSFLQPACVTALEQDPSAMRESYRQRGRYVWDRLRKMGLDVETPQGGFYLFPSIKAFGMDSETFCLRLIEEAGLALTPGSCFDGEGHVRISCCYSMETLREAMDRLERWIGKIPAAEVRIR